MLLPGDLAFRVAAVLLLVVFPAFGFVLRRKWRVALARRDEINRLIVLAAEEAARAELEASIGYDYHYGYVAAAPAPVPVPVPVSGPIGQRVCAVCFTPTPHRCARCKSVNYCSGKCQIIHWRQGHKDECRPLPATSEINDEGINFAGNGVKQPYSDDYFTDVENGGLPQKEQGEMAPKESGLSSPAYSPEELSVKDGNSAVKRSPYEVELNPVSELHESSGSSTVYASFSGHGTSTDDSISDDGVHDYNSDSWESCSTSNNLETASSDRRVEHTKPVEEENFKRVESGGSIAASGGLENEVQVGIRGSSGTGISRSNKNSSEPSKLTSGFWDGTLDSSRTRKYVPSISAKAKFVGSCNGKLPDSKSSLMSPDLSSNAHSLVSKASGISRADKLIVEPTLLDKESIDSPKHQSSTLSTLKMPATKLVGTGSDDEIIKSQEVGSPGYNSKHSNLFSSSKIDTGRSAKESVQSSVPNKARVALVVPNDSSSSGMKEHNTPVIKCDSVTMPPDVSRSTSSASVGLKTSMLKVVEQLRAPMFSKHGNGVGRKNEKGVFPYELFVKLYHWKKVEFLPCGLINCGNSCYANVVLQCLAFTPPLTAYLLQGLHSKSCAKTDWCFTCEFESLILKAKEGGYPRSPIGILSQIQKIGSHLASGREEDAHEFLRYAIDTMQSICLQEAGVKASSSLEEETTLTGLTFGGYLRSKIKCMRCHGNSERQERMMDLTVEIEGDIETLEDALQRFTGTESLDGENKYHCGRCKSYEKAKKKLNILEAPNVLTIALKRFQSGKFGKLNKPIRFPEILNLAPYMRGGNDKSPIYRLYGVVVHLDIMNASFSGHYVCYVRNAQNKWYKIDDSTVKPVELERVLNKGAYMLFYSRCSPRAPRSIRSTITSRDYLPSKIKNPALDPSRSIGRISTSRQRDSSARVNHIPDDLASLRYGYQDEIRLRPIQNICEGDSSSDSSSLFSNSDEASTSTESTRESISADEFSEYIFGYTAFSRHSSDSDTSSSSSSSSSPQYMKHSPLSNPARYASGLSEQNGLLTDNGKAHHDSCRAEESSSLGGVSFLHSNSSKQVRNLVNISSREADAERLGWANPLDNGVHLRRSSRKKAD